MKKQTFVMNLVAGAVLAYAGGATAAMPQGEALDLARQSGCLACHSVENKVVGPAWTDVSMRYRGRDPEMVKAELIEKVRSGGKGNWTEVTGGVPMPPYGQRVADEDIEKLVDFVLSIAR